MGFVKRYFLGLVVLLIALIVLFTGLAFVAGHTPAPVSSVARKAASLATPRG